MSYQESYISTKDNKDMDKILNIFKKCNIRCFNDKEASCISKITLKKDIQHEDYSFEKGKEFLYISGERFTQKSLSNLFKLDDKMVNKLLSKEELNLISTIDIIFAESLPTEDIFNNKTDYATIEYLKLEPIKVNKKYLELSRKFLDKMCENNEFYHGDFEVMHSYSLSQIIQKKNDLIKICKEMDLDLEIKQGDSCNFNGIDEEVYSIEGLDLFYCSKQASPEGLYTWSEPSYNKQDNQCVEKFARFLENVDKNKC